MAERKAKRLPKPTASELEILNVLWRIGPSTVRAVHAELERVEPTGYTTVLKLMQIMATKGLLRRDDSATRAHIYTPAVARENTETQLVTDLLDRLFRGSSAQLVLRALADRPASKQELQEIREMIDRLDKETSK